MLRLALEEIEFCFFPEQNPRFNVVQNEIPTVCDNG
jgi:hypothetical protein